MVTASPLLDVAQRYINRELSILAFNRRILEQAQNVHYPLLERVRFLSICANNIDEFTMVRVANIEERMKREPTKRTDDGLLPSEHIAVMTQRKLQLLQELQATWLSLRQELLENGIVIVEPTLLPQIEQQWLRRHYVEHVFPLLTPMAVDPAHPFPFIQNSGVALALEMREKNTSEMLNAVVPLPLQLSRFIRLPDKKDDQQIRFVMLESLITAFLDELFPDFFIVSRGLFRVLRNSDIEVDEDVEDLRRYYETAIKKRSRSHIIRLSITQNTPVSMQQFLARQMGVSADRVFINKGMLRSVDTAQLIVHERPELLFKSFVPRMPERLQEFDGNIFSAIAAKDFVVHHPYESFDVVVDFIRQAAHDADVLAIKQTVYRTSKDSPIMHALIEAAEQGKSVTCMVELKARFDEEANLRWARDLQRAGVQIIYGFVDLKTHAKMALVVRRESKGLVTYAHFGTGNYNPHTARTYTDLSYFTCDPVLCGDAAHLFNYMTGYASPHDMKKIIAAPLHMRQKIMALIDDEISCAKAGKPASMWAKVNALVDTEIIEKLYEASAAGVQVDLVVRSGCSLRPGVKGLSENIRIKSIVGRFLEHARIFCFGAGHALPSPHAKIYISSADLMPRNLDRRIELMVPIDNPTVHQQVLNQVMLANMLDNASSWELRSDGSYRRVTTNQQYFSAHDYFLDHPSLSGRGAHTGKKMPPQLVLHHATTTDVASGYGA